MTERHTVLIGDENPARAEWLRQFLNNRYYAAPPLIGDTLDKIRMMARKMSGSVIFLADSLPYSLDTRVTAPVGHLNQLAGLDPTAELVCVVTGDAAPTMSGLNAPVLYIRLSSDSPTPEEQAQIVNALQPLRDKLPLMTTTFEAVAKLTKYDRLDRTLQRQIGSLSNAGDLQEGWKYFHRILRDCLDFRDIKDIHVEPLTKGKSGALVFLLRVGLKPQNGAGKNGRGQKKITNFVLKLSHTENVWKLQSEVRGYLEAGKTALYNRYKKHVPALQTPTMPSSMRGATPEEFRFIASQLPWDAIYYDFLGGDLGECMALETALISSPEKIKQRTTGICNPNMPWVCSAATDLNTFRTGFLTTLLDALCDIWYLNETSKCKPKIPWTRKNADDRRYAALPPYQFTAYTKNRIQEFLDGEDDEIGRRLFTEWDECKNRLLALIDGSKGAKPLGVLGTRIPMIVSPVHGDLNANNAFLWLKQEKFPFLIDLPFYQSEGHVLQDFARLEVEVKFLLMDRQEESPRSKLAAFDLSPEQVPLWCELENHLMDNWTAGPPEPKWHSPGFGDNVQLTYQLVSLIRNRAARVHEKLSRAAGTPALPFTDEYSIPLLYHTARTVTYQSLSVFKRLLAVYSAGSILKRFHF